MTIKDEYKQNSTLDQELITQCKVSNDTISSLCQIDKEFTNLHKELPFFIHALFAHQVLEDFSKAKKLYKEALRRAEFTKGCYNMLVSIYLVESQYSDG